VLPLLLLLMLLLLLLLLLLQVLEPHDEHWQGKAGRPQDRPAGHARSVSAAGAVVQPMASA
jgi:hypothetical protein